MSLKKTMYPLQVFVRDGEKCTLRVSIGDTFASIKDKIWQKKLYARQSYNNRILHNTFVFRPYGIDIVLQLNDQVAKLVYLTKTFPKGSHKDLSQSKSNMLRCECLPKSMCEDATMRKAQKPSRWVEVSKQGAMTIYESAKNKHSVRGNVKRALLGSSGHRGWFIMQSYTLFHYEHEEKVKDASTQRYKPCRRFIALGSVVAMQVPSPDSTRPFAMILVPAEDRHKVVGHLDIKKLDTDIFCLENQQELGSWMKKINEVQFRRVRSVVFHTCQELQKESRCQEEGIFRVPGSTSQMHDIQERYDRGYMPSLEKVGTHSIAGVLKFFVRNIPEPFLTHFYYKQFMDAGRHTDRKQCLAKFTKVVNGLPPWSKGISRFLLEFLYKVAAYSKVNKMNPNNLAIVFAPNILKPLARDTTDIRAIMVKSKEEEQVVAKLIMLFPLLFQEEDIKLMMVSAKPTNTRTRRHKGNTPDFKAFVQNMQSNYMTAMDSNIPQNHQKIQELWASLTRSAQQHGGDTPKGFSQVASHIASIEKHQQALLQSVSTLLNTLETACEGMELVPVQTDTTEAEFQAEAMFDFVAEEENEMSVHVGDIVSVLDSSDEWWRARKVSRPSKLWRCSIYEIWLL